MTARIRHEPAIGADAIRSRRLAGWLSAFVFVLLLAGQFTLERIGLGNPLPMPERAAVAVILAIALGPVALAELRRLPPQRHIPGVPPVMCFFGLLLLSALWALPSLTLAEAVWDVVVLIIAIVALVVALRLSASSAVTVFFVAALASGLLFAVAGLLAPATRVAAFGGGPNVFARVTGVGIVAAIYLASRDHGRRRGYLIALVPVLVAATVMSGSRGAMLGTGAGLLVLALTLSARGWRRILLWTLLASPVVVLIIDRFGATVMSTIQHRIVRLTLQEGYTAGRTPLLDAAREMFADRPIAGWGLHGFSALHAEWSGAVYPHNLVIQVAAETGVIGLLALALVTVAVVKALRPAWRRPDVAAPLAASVLVLVASQFSGDYYDSRFGWAFLVIALAAADRARREAVDAGQQPEESTVVDRARG